MYERTDRIIDYLLEQLIRYFNRAKVLIKGFDEINLLDYSAHLYGQLDITIKEAYMKLAKSTAKDVTDSAEELITMNWLMGKLEEYNPVTKYRYDYELERKRQRFVEAILSSPDNQEEEIQKALISLSKMVSQYAIEITDSALLVGYEQLGIKKVQWHTEEDEKVCSKCKKLNKKIFDIKQIPIKPHWNCRCYVEPIKEG